jgi:hypothetical protein
MLKRLMAVALLTPMLTLAQEQPAPQAAPPGAVPAYPANPVSPPPPAPARAHTRDSWYIGFGFGTGGGSVKGQGDTLSFSDMNLGRDPTNLMLNFKVGATLSPTLLLGFDLSALRSQASDSLATTAVQVTNYDAMLTWFPWETGLNLRGGVGLSVLTWDLDVLGSSSWTGGNLDVGVGYAFWLGKSFNLTLNLDLSAQGYGSSNDAPESSTTWMLWAGFDWY